MDSGQLYDAVIVGGGLAGTTVAAELALSAPPGFRALLIEAGEPGPGSGYAPASERLYMNGTALAMSAAPRDKRDLVRWLRTEPDHAQISRRLFGRYLSDRFRAAVSHRPEFEVGRTEVVDLVPHDEGFTVVDAQGGQRTARDVVLALGNFAPDYSFLPPALHRHPGFVADPWRFDPSFDATREDAIRNGDALIIGGGLTAMDASALLHERGFRGRTHMVSRHGLSPCVDNPFAHALDPQTLHLDTSTPLTMLRSMRAAVRRHVQRGGDWRDVVESIRAMTPDLWSGWSLAERRRFLRHVAAFWAIHRYRVPAKTAAVCE